MGHNYYGEPAWPNDLLYIFPVVIFGTIAAIIGLKDVATGDTLCDMKEVIILEKMTFPEPVISIAIEPRTKADQERMIVALEKLSQEEEGAEPIAFNPESAIKPEGFRYAKNRSKNIQDSVYSKLFKQ